MEFEGAMNKYGGSYCLRCYAYRTRAMLSQGGPRDASVNFSTY